MEWSCRDFGYLGRELGCQLDEAPLCDLRDLAKLSILSQSATKEAISICGFISAEDQCMEGTERDFNHFQVLLREEVWLHVISKEH